jgi:hypothetical protein
VSKAWKLHPSPDKDPNLKARVRAAFSDLTEVDIGGGSRIAPGILLLSSSSAIIMFIGIGGGLGLAASLLNGSHKPPIPIIMPLELQSDLISTAAIFGAYTWSVTDAITRSDQWRLHPSDLTWYSLRLIIAIPLGHANWHDFIRALPRSRRAPPGGYLGPASHYFEQFSDLARSTPMKLASKSSDDGA